MNLDDLRQEWLERDQRLEKSIQLHTRLLRESQAHRQGSVVRRLSLFQFLIQLPFYVLVIGGLGRFIAGHIQEPQFFVPALLMNAWTIAMLAALVHQFVAASRLELTDSLVRVQKQVTEIKVTRLRTLKWGFLTGSLVWSAPFLIVAAQAAFDVDLTSMPAFLAFYTAGSCLVAVLVVLTLQRFSARFPAAKFVNEVRDSLAGEDLAEASAFLKRIATFESETMRA